MTAIAPLPSRRNQLRGRRNGAALPALRFALPSKGMEQQTLDFLSTCGMKVSRPNPRQYRATIPALAGVEVMGAERGVDRLRGVDEGVVAGLAKGIGSRQRERGERESGPVHE